MILPTPSSTRTYPLFPYTTLVRSAPVSPHPLAARRRRFRPAPRAAVAVGHARTRLARAAPGHPPRAAGAALPAGHAGDPHRRHAPQRGVAVRSEEHTSELQSLMRISYAVFCLKKKKNNQNSTIIVKPA